MDERRVECGDVADDDVDGAIRTVVSLQPGVRCAQLSFPMLRALGRSDRVLEMMSRLPSVVVLLSMILMGTVSPAEACAIWCAGSHGGHEHHAAVAQGMSGHHHHAGTTRLDPMSSSSVGTELCATDCSAAVARVEGRSLPQERVKPLTSVVVDAGIAERDGWAVAHFEAAGPPGLARGSRSILRV